VKAAATQAGQDPVPYTARDMSRYPAEAQFSRSALAPGLLGAIVLLAGLALVGTSWETFVLYAAAILALIQCVFAWQGRQWWWLIGLIPIAVLWNPVWPISIPDLAWRLMQLAGAVVFIATAVSIKIPIHRADEGNRAQRRVGPQGGGRPKR
jgi:hypothetical protein